MLKKIAKDMQIKCREHEFMFLILWNIYFKVWILKTIYTNLVFRILGFRRNCGKYTSISKFVFLYVAYDQYPTCFEHSSFIYKKILEVLKMCFRMNFLNKKQNLFSCIFGFYNMFIKLQRVLANIPKNIKILFSGEFIYYSPLMFE